MLICLLIKKHGRDTQPVMKTERKEARELGKDRSSKLHSSESSGLKWAIYTRLEHRPEPLGQIP